MRQISTDGHLTYFIKVFRRFPSFYILWNNLHWDYLFLKFNIPEKVTKSGGFGGNSLIVFFIHSNETSVFKFTISIVVNLENCILKKKISF